MTAEAVTGWSIGSGRLSASVTASGELRQIAGPDDLAVTQYPTGFHDFSLTTVLLRHFDGEGHCVSVSRLTGSGNDLEVGDRSVRWTGTSNGVRHLCSLTLDPDTMTWCWSAKLKSADGAPLPGQFDVVFTQALALAPENMAQSSEAYVCQYLVQKAFVLPGTGWVLACRQSMALAPRLPLVVSWIRQGAAGFRTDAIDLYGPGARLDGIGEPLRNNPWENRGRQYEMSAPTLVTNRFSLDRGQDFEMVSVLSPDYRGALQDAVEGTDSLLDTGSNPCLPDPALTPQVPSPSELKGVPLAQTQPLPEDEFARLGGGPVKLPETAPGGGLLSYFGDGACHVVAGRKELGVERSHGEVLRCGPATVGFGALSATCYAPGVFLSHITVGNTNFNRLVTVHRHPLNLLRSSGVRLLVELEGQWHLLGVASAIAFDLGGVRWVYQVPGLRVEVFVSADPGSNQLTLRARTDRPIRFLSTWDLESATGGEGLWEQVRSDHSVDFFPADWTEPKDKYPELGFRLATSGTVTSDAAPGVQRLNITTQEVEQLVIAVTASETGEAAVPDLHRSYADDVRGFRHQISRLTDGLRITSAANPHDFQELDLLIPWYAHNAMVHLLTPHGLEQYSGAAWGTRDVVQGPLEFFLAFGHFEQARDILLRVYARQFEDGNFPQWFMFDRYEGTYTKESHGDVAVWPMFALAEYLSATGDLGILDAKVPFWDNRAGARSTGAATIRDHVLRELDYLEANQVPGWNLPAYGHGDWDDTLQPADSGLRSHMASGWTSALLIQATALMASQLKGHVSTELARRLEQLHDRTLADFKAVMTPDGQVAGYMVAEADGPRYMLHPRQQGSSLTTRLIPLTRSIIGGLLTQEEAAQQIGVIETELLYPHGVHLMNQFAPFDEGKTRTFVRAEQAATVGREVGLMYTHAHIRLVEALAALGDPLALRELLRISPIGADPGTHEPRQRNTYYSSSDASFDDRYEARAGLDDLREGRVKSRGGWRIYSSGPGIYLRQLLQSVLGLTLAAGHITISPSLPAEADGLLVDLEVDGLMRRFAFRKGDELAVAIGPEAGAVRSIPVEVTRNRYGRASAEVSVPVLGSAAYVEITFPRPAAK